ncbi:hypothetical protein CT0861_02672, partial [Colletotrichum tofieldiae]
DRLVASIEGPSGVEVVNFKPDWKAIEVDYKAASAKISNDPVLAKRINTQSASNVAFGQAVYAAGNAAVNQITVVADWNQAREQFNTITTQIMMDHNPDKNKAVAAVCYNMNYDIKDSNLINGLSSEELSIWPAHTKGNVFWPHGDGGTMNLMILKFYTRWYHGACTFDRGTLAC